MIVYIIFSWILVLNKIKEKRSRKANTKATALWPSFKKSKKKKICKKDKKKDIIFHSVKHTRKFSIFSSRQNPIFDDDRFHQSLDAWHIFPKRENRPISQYFAAKSLCQSISKWRRSVQYKGVANLRLFHAPGAVPSWQADLQSWCGQLWVSVY